MTQDDVVERLERLRFREVNILSTGEVILVRKSEPMTEHAEVDVDGMINGELPESYIKSVEKGRISMNKVAAAKEMLKLAKSLTAWETDSLLDSVLDQREMADLSGHIDDQTYDLMVETYQKLQSDFKLSSGQREAINRIGMSCKSGKSWQPDMHRNNIFKAAHALGIRLPSSMF